ncbi:MAG: acyl-ACP thioesterase domain-containing protein [Actinomycetota bacterium]
MPEPGAAEITPKPAAGRVFENTRRIRLAEVDPTGRCRLDATVRHLQDVARDDSADSGLSDPMTWVVRRTMLEVHRAPVFQERIDLATWCSGHGGRWAERRTEVRGEHGAHVDAVTIWIYVDGDTGAPRKLNDDFFEIYGSATDRKVSARLQLPNQPPDDAASLDWPIRFVDLDVLGHVNNAAQWAPVEEIAHRLALPLEGVRAQLEHGGETPPGAAIIRWVGDDTGVRTWLTTANGTGSTADVRRL